LQTSASRPNGRRPNGGRCVVIPGTSGGTFSSPRNPHRAAPSRCREFFQTWKVQAIEDALLRHAALAGHFHCMRSLSVECASGLMLITPPNSSARECQRQSRSRRRGLVWISSAPPSFAQDRNIFSVSISSPAGAAVASCHVARDRRPRMRRGAENAWSARAHSCESGCGRWRRRNRIG
jgi:hypothetical protein